MSLTVWRDEFQFYALLSRLRGGCVCMPFWWEVLATSQALWWTKWLLWWQWWGILLWVSECIRFCSVNLFQLENDFNHLWRPMALCFWSLHHYVCIKYFFERVYLKLHEKYFQQNIWVEVPCIFGLLATCMMWSLCHFFSAFAGMQTATLPHSLLALATRQSVCLVMWYVSQMRPPSAQMDRTVWAAWVSSGVFLGQDVCVP